MEDRAPPTTETVQTWNACVSRLKETHAIAPLSEATLRSIEADLSTAKLYAHADEVFVFDGVAWADATYRGAESAAYAAVQLTGEASVGHLRSMAERAKRTYGVHVVRLSLGADHGRVSMRPEGLVDKLGELFEKREVDFAEHRAFSDAYYVLAEDEARFRRAVDGSLLDALARHPGLLVEVVADRLYATTPDAMNARDAERLGALVADANRSAPRNVR